MNTLTMIILAILLVPLGAALLNGLLSLSPAARRKGCGRLAAGIACAASLASFVLTLVLWRSLSDAAWPAVTAPFSTGSLFTWIDLEGLRIDVGFTVDALSLLLMLIITGVGSLIHLYSVAYMAGDRGVIRYFSYLNLFLFFMLLLVGADNLVVLFAGWEGVGLCSYLLIGFWYEDRDKASAGKKAFIVNRIGDFGFILALLLLYKTLATHLSEDSPFAIAALATHLDLLAPYATPLALLFFLGAAGKSAQIPLHVWLPDAMAGPTPVSALIHAATMVTAGVYLIARLFFLFAASDLALDVVLGIGAGTALVAASVALTQTDIKKVLAYSTVSQLGYMMLALGAGAPTAAIFHLFTHAFFKACLFLGAGSVIHALSGEQDIRRMGGLYKKMPLTAVSFVLAALALAGVPPLSGFFSKDAILEAVWRSGHPLTYAIAFLTAGLSAFYMMRLSYLVFFGKEKHASEDPAHASPSLMTVPVALLALCAAFAGFLNIPVEFGGSAAFHAWLAPAIGVLPSPAAPHLPVGLALAPALWAVVISITAYGVYQRAMDDSGRIRRLPLAAIHRVALHGYDIDRLYALAITRPLAWLSAVALDRMSEQTFFNKVGIGLWPGLARKTSATLSRAQTGRISTALFYMAIAVAVLAALILAGGKTP